MKNVLRVIILLTTMACLSCSKDYSSIVDDWKEEGWRVVEELGETGDYSHYTELKSEEAPMVEASWTIGGLRKTKLFRQDSKRYLVLHFKKADGDVFAVVMSKRW